MELSFFDDIRALPPSDGKIKHFYLCLIETETRNPRGYNRFVFQIYLNQSPHENRLFKNQGEIAISENIISFFCKKGTSRNSMFGETKEARKDYLHSCVELLINNYISKSENIFFFYINDLISEYGMDSAEEYTNILFSALSPHKNVNILIYIDPSLTFGEERKERYRELLNKALNRGGNCKPESFFRNLLTKIKSLFSI